MQVEGCSLHDFKATAHTEPAQGKQSRDNRGVDRVLGSRTMTGIVILQAIAAVFALALYFLPSILADRRKRHDVLTLALFNACLGWTGFGWLLALYWSLQPNPPKNVAGEVAETRKIVRMRAFSSALLVRVQKRATARERGEK
jgi:Superinfection immunity protein